MDLFFDTLPTRQKFRRHYHHFLLSLYSLVSQRVFLLFSKIPRVLVNPLIPLIQLIQSGSRSSTHHKSSDSRLDKPIGYLPPIKDRLRTKALTHGWRSVFAGGADPRDPVLNGPEFVLAQVARDLLLTHGWLLAFDEIQMVDVAGAGILSRVLEWYWRLGGVVIGTSNRVPEHMYDQGVQKSTVVPFLDRLKLKSPTVTLVSHSDWRLKLAAQSTAGSHWFLDLDLDRWRAIVNRHLRTPTATELTVYARTITVARSDPESRAALFTYQELCEAPLGPADYLKICSTFETIMIENVPVFTSTMKNEARRLITLVDACYECAVKLYVSAQAPIDALFFPDVLAGPAPDTQSSPIELETLADTVSDLAEPFRPNVSAYTSSTVGGGEVDTSPVIARQLAIFTGQDEQYAFERATSRLHELTRAGGRQWKQWTPVESLETRIQSARLSTSASVDGDADLALDVDRLAEADGQEARDEPPKISDPHFWGIAKWGRRAGRWGRGAEAYEIGRGRK